MTTKSDYLDSYRKAVHSAADGDYEGLDMALDAMADAAVNEDVEQVVFYDDLSDIDSEVDKQNANRAYRTLR